MPQGFVSFLVKAGVAVIVGASVVIPVLQDSIGSLDGSLTMVTSVLSIVPILVALYLFVMLARQVSGVGA